MDQNKKLVKINLDTIQGDDIDISNDLLKPEKDFNPEEQAEEIMDNIDDDKD